MTVSPAVSRVLAARYGLDAARLCDWRIARATEARRKELRLATAEEYDLLVASDGGEQRSLVERLLVHESSFFRHPRSFEHMADALRAGRHRPTAARPLRILCVGCASGEEPYSAAITALDAGVPAAHVRVTAVDLSPGVLATAERGVYGERSLARVSPELRQRYFARDGAGELRVVDAVRALVTFRLANVLEPAGAPTSAHELVFCRNLLIYLSPGARERLASLLMAALAADGTLYSGQSELPPLARLGFVVDDASALALLHPSRARGAGDSRPPGGARRG